MSVYSMQTVTKEVKLLIRIPDLDLIIDLT